MLVGAFVFSLAAASVLGAPALEGRIVNGSDAALGEFPFMVSLRGQNRHGCGASIISKKFVLTAAHCIHGWEQRPDLFSVQYGVVEISEKEPNVFPVKKITKHEEYVHTGGYPNDVAVLEIEGEFVFGPNAQPVSLPTPFEDPGDNVDVLLSGWGLNQSGGTIPIHLKKVTLEKFSSEYCLSKDSRFNSDMNICAGVLGGGKGQCTGDSGGPLTIKGKQFGIVSWSKKPCANAENPGMFTKVAAMRTWIRMKTGV